MIFQTKHTREQENKQRLFDRSAEMMISERDHHIAIQDAKIAELTVELSKQVIASRRWERLYTTEHARVIELENRPQTPIAGYAHGAKSTEPMYSADQVVGGYVTDSSGMTINEAAFTEDVTPVDLQDLSQFPGGTRVRRRGRPRKEDGNNAS